MLTVVKPARTKLVAHAQSSDEFRALADDALAGMYIAVEQCFHYVNRAFERIFGYGPGELDGAEVLSVCHPDDRALVAANAQRRIDGEATSLRYECRGLRKDGTALNIEIFSSASIIGGRPALAGTIVDTTARVAAARVTEEREALLRQAVEVAQIGPYVIDTERGIIHMSAELARLYRAGDGPLDLSLDEYRARFQPLGDDRAVELMQGGETAPGLSVVDPILREDGQLRWTRASSSVELGPDGRPRIVGTVQDVTERVLADEALRASEGRFRALVNGAPVAIGIARGGQILWVNQAYRHLFQIELDADLTGRSLIEQVAPEDRPMMLDRTMRRERGEDMPTLYEAQGIRRDGSRFTCLMAVAVTQLPDGPASVAFLSDVSALKQAEADIALAGRVRELLVEALHALPHQATAERAARVVCDALIALPGIDVVTVLGFGQGRMWSLAAAGADELVPPSTWVPHSRSRRLIDRASHGPWAERWTPVPDDGRWARALTAAQIQAVGYAPIIHGDHVDGLVALGTRDPDFAQVIVDRFRHVLDLTGPASALFAERVHAWREQNDVRADVGRVLEERAFAPVFQPIVGLVSRRIVGYEALTRFSSGRAPHDCFADARAVGLGADLEIATLEAAVRESAALSAGCWLEVNVSPSLLLESARLRDVLAGANRPIVAEVTEHEVIADYGALHSAVRLVGKNLWLAVDDAGAGIANFAHIIELRPDIVKLDISLVRDVDTDIARQALVLAMVSFTASAGCSLVAEGIETAAEAITLAELGVAFGQGYFLGRPTSLDRVRRPVDAGQPDAADRRASPHLPPQWARRQAFTRLERRASVPAVPASRSALLEMPRLSLALRVPIPEPA